MHREHGPASAEPCKIKKTINKQLHVGGFGIEDIPYIDASVAGIQSAVHLKPDSCDRPKQPLAFFRPSFAKKTDH